MYIFTLQVKGINSLILLKLLNEATSLRAFVAIDFIRLILFVQFLKYYHHPPTCLSTSILAECVMRIMCCNIKV